MSDTTETSNLPSSPSVLSPSISLPNAHHFLSLKLTSTNYLFWRTQLTPFLRGQGLMGFVDGSKPCPPSTIVTDDDPSPRDNPDYSVWVQQDQLHMSTLISSLSPDVFPLVVGLQTSQAIWSALESSLASPSNTRILNLHMQLQNLKQGDSSVSTFLQQAKSINDELAAVGRPLSLSKFNIYVFKGLRTEFKDLVTTLSARPTPVSFSELHSLLLSHEFINADAVPSIPPPPSPPPTSASTPTVHLTQRTPANSGRGPGASSRSRGRGRYSRGRSPGHGSYHQSSYPSSSPFQYPSPPSYDTHLCCQICNQFGHTAGNWRLRYSHSSPPLANLAFHAPSSSYAD